MKPNQTELLFLFIVVSLPAGIAGAPSRSGQQQQRKAQAQESELPVFCVSAKDCQRIEGRTSKDGFPSAFTKIEYTEMPQLRKHVHHVTGTALSSSMMLMQGWHCHSASRCCSHLDSMSCCISFNVMA